MMRHAPCCSDRDICMATYIQGKAPSEIPVSTAMSKGVFFTTPETNVQDVLKIMDDQKINQIPVVEGKRLIGIIARERLLNMLRTRMMLEDKLTLCRFLD